jgi:predicted lipoprotein with Yx(FWY)xxD motif
MKNVRRINVGIAIVVFAVAMSQCSKKNSSTTNSTPPPAPTTLVSLRTDGNLGNYLIDSSGHALYFFANDADGKNNCGGGCAASWPAYEGSGLTSDQLGAGLDLSDFGSTPSSTGRTQLTYKGWPLYLFAPSGTPEAAGHASGDGAGGIWFVAKPDYSIMLANWQLVGKDGKNYKSDYTPGDGTTIYFTDALGHTLYAYSKDSVDHNKFTASDFSNNSLWPVYDSASSLSFPSALDKTDFNSTSVFGRTQLTYRGWPLYYFGADSSLRARNKGITVGSAPGSAGQVWSVMIKGIDGAPHQ